MTKLITLLRNTRYKALYQCACGKYFSAYKYNVLSGHTKSCGCLGRSDVSRSRTYKAWINMKTRCLNPNTPFWKNYGGRGISIHQPWIESYEQFVNDMGPCPEKLTLDRIDVNGDYKPGNCRWATMRQQARNQRRNRLLSFAGKTQTLVEWATELQLKPNTLEYRILRGWPVEKALRKKAA